MNTDPKQTKSARDFERMLAWTSAFSMGVAAGFMASVRQINPTVEFRFSIASVAAFVIASVFTLLVFRVILRRSDGANATTTYRRWLVTFCVAVSVALLASFSVALRNVSYERRMDVLIGASLALAALAGIALLAWRIFRFLEADARWGNDKNKRD
jgi:hypothetical protein